MYNYVYLHSKSSSTIPISTEIHDKNITLVHRANTREFKLKNEEKELTKVSL